MSGKFRKSQIQEVNELFSDPNKYNSLLYAFHGGNNSEELNELKESIISLTSVTRVKDFNQESTQEKLDAFFDAATLTNEATQSLDKSTDNVKEKMEIMLNIVDTFTNDIFRYQAYDEHNYATVIAQANKEKFNKLEKSINDARATMGSDDYKKVNESYKELESNFKNILSIPEVNCVAKTNYLKKAGMNKKNISLKTLIAFAAPFGLSLTTFIPIAQGLISGNFDLASIFSSVMPDFITTFAVMAGVTIAGEAVDTALQNNAFTKENGIRDQIKVSTKKKELFNSLSKENNTRKGRKKFEQEFNINLGKRKKKNYNMLLEAKDKGNDISDFSPKIASLNKKLKKLDKYVPETILSKETALENIEELKKHLSSDNPVYSYLLEAENLLSNNTKVVRESRSVEKRPEETKVEKDKPKKASRVETKIAEEINDFSKEKETTSTTFEVEVKPSLFSKLKYSISLTKKEFKDTSKDAVNELAKIVQKFMEKGLTGSKTVAKDGIEITVKAMPASKNTGKRS